LANAYVCLNRIDDAQKTLAQAETLHIANPTFWEVRYEIAFLRADASGMENVFNSTTGQGQDGVFAFQADTEAYYGHLAKARKLAHRGIEAARRNGDTDGATGYAIVAALHDTDFGNLRRAREEVSGLVADALDVQSRALIAIVLARTGAEKPALAIASDLSHKWPSNTLVNGYWIPTIAAAVYSSKDPAKAIEHLDAALKYDLALPQTPTNTVPYPVYLRGVAFLEQGDGTSAAQEFQKILDHPGIVGNYPLGALAHLGLARAFALQEGVWSRYTGRGMIPLRDPKAPSSEKLLKARKAYADFLTLWKDADSDIPILKQAQLESRRLSQLAGNKN
jgi:tetratricopeptide (TPR) repeat protein